MPEKTHFDRLMDDFSKVEQGPEQISLDCETDWHWLRMCWFPPKDRQRYGVGWWSKSLRQPSKDGVPKDPKAWREVQAEWKQAYQDYLNGE